MKTNPSLFLAACLVLVAPLNAQPHAELERPLSPGELVTVLRTPEELDALLGPVALYPDAMIALILPAATASTDIVLANRYLEGRDDTAGVDEQAWDESVRSLAHYPEVLEWLDENLDWTRQVGEAFVAQPADVMKAIQRLRARARANGTLIDTPQQRILYDVDAIRIIPADPEVIYVPRYDPQIVYVEHRTYYPSPLITFGFGFRVGSWLRYDFDWHRRNIWVTRHDWRWHDRRDWWHARFHHQLGRGPDHNWNTWRPRDQPRPRVQAFPGGPRINIARPAPFVERPRRDDNDRRREIPSGSDRRFVRRDGPSSPPPANVNPPTPPPSSGRAWNGRNDRTDDDSRSSNRNERDARPRRDTPAPAPVVVNRPPAPPSAPVVATPPPARVAREPRTTQRTWGSEIRRSRSESSRESPPASAPVANTRREERSAPPAAAPRAAPAPERESRSTGQSSDGGGRTQRTWGSVIRGER